MRGSRRGAVRHVALLGLLVAALAVLVGAAPATAHDYLVSSDPADGSTVTTAPAAVTLTFDAAVLSTGNGATVLAVTGPGGKHYETGCPVVKNDDLSAAVRLGPAGTYTATWRVVSSDGHPVSDSVRFRYAPAAGASAAGGSANGPACGSVVQHSGGPSASSASSSGVVVLIAVVAGVLVLLVLAAAVVAVVATRRRT